MIRTTLGAMIAIVAAGPLLAQTPHARPVYEVASIKLNTSGSGRDDRPLLLRTLLEDRFQLSVHRESKDVAGYALVMAKTGFKLKPVEPGGAAGIDDRKGGHVLTLTAKKASMARLADNVARSLAKPVLDQTGIDGVYDFELRWTTDDLTNTDDLTKKDNGPTRPLRCSLRSKRRLACALLPQKVPVQIIVVDHVERAPTEN
jgi:uncharacterized protein (TIGR03435 family)